MGYMLVVDHCNHFSSLPPEPKFNMSKVTVTLVSYQFVFAFPPVEEMKVEVNSGVPKVLTKLIRIPDSVENTSVTT
jgi:hypothetical protein